MPEIESVSPNITDQLTALSDALGNTHDTIFITRPKGENSEIACVMCGDPEALSRMLSNANEHLVIGLVLDVKRLRKL